MSFLLALIALKSRLAGIAGRNKLLIKKEALV